MSTKSWICFVSFLCLGTIARGEESFGNDLVIKDRVANLEQKLTDLITSLSLKHNETNVRISELASTIISRLTKLENTGDSILSKQKSSESQISNITASISSLHSQSDKILENHFDLVIPSCKNAKVTGVYRLQDPSINVFCEASIKGGAWLVIQKRLNGDVDFNENWYAYRTGFGTVGPYSEFWLGLEAIHQITSRGEYELHIAVGNETSEEEFALYSLFKIASETENYKLTIGGYSGTAGDALSSHNNTKFSTLDMDNDERTIKNCADKYQSGWWFTKCGESNLNGPFEKATNGNGIKWGTFTKAGTFSRMMIRRK